MAWYNDLGNTLKGAGQSVWDWKSNNLDQYNVIGDPGGLGHIKDGPNKGDTTAIDQSVQDARAQAQALGAERAGYQDRAAPVIDQTNANQIRQQQLAALGGLQAAANGTTPSAAALQAEQARQANVANQFGMAAAFRGRSPGAAQAQASRGAAMINAQASASGAAQRAAEQAQARNALVAALGGVRQQDTGVATDQAQLQLAQQGQDQDWRKALLGGQVASTGQEGTAAGTYAKLLQDQADAKNKSEAGYRQLFASMFAG